MLADVAVGSGFLITLLVVLAIVALLIWIVRH